jgi:hypothetical protein
LRFLFSTTSKNKKGIDMNKKTFERYQVTVEHCPASEDEPWTWHRTRDEAQKSLENTKLPNWLLNRIVEVNLRPDNARLRAAELQVWVIISREKRAGVIYCHDEHGEVLFTEPLEPLPVPLGDITLYFKDIDQLFELEVIEEEWIWEEAFDKFGFYDGDGEVHTDEVAAVLEDAGYHTKVSTWGMHNSVICSLTAPDGTELIPGGESNFAFGYDNARKYLPLKVVKILDRAFPARAKFE